jgi:hypothetical protein
VRENGCTGELIRQDSRQQPKVELSQLLLGLTLAAVACCVCFGYVLIHYAGINGVYEQDEENMKMCYHPSLLYTFREVNNHRQAEIDGIRTADRRQTKGRQTGDK